MNVFVHDASLVCEECATELSGAQGPYPNGGGEADTPQHCDCCNKFLRNPLTSDGAAYVRSKMPSDLYHLANNAVLSEWYEFYRHDYDIV